MKSYRSISSRTGKPSGIIGYDYDSASITVYFKNGAIYHYTIDSCGSIHIETIKRLADSQNGLNTYLTLNKPKEAWKR